MTKIQNIYMSEKEIDFEEVGVIKSDENGVFEIPNDDVANLVASVVNGFSLYKEPVVEEVIVEDKPKKSKKADTTPSEPAPETAPESTEQAPSTEEQKG